VVNAQFFFSYVGRVEEKKEGDKRRKGRREKRRGEEEKGRELGKRRN
jgi:hypothetical protein